MSTETEMKPCPCCASADLYRADFGEVLCRECGTSGSCCELWNRRACQWLPIDTAPKPKSDLAVDLLPDVLLFYPKRGVRRGFFQFGGWIFSDWQDEGDQPTHWQPLPEPPQIPSV